ncbi:MAG TPA: MBL fold metallo-hydrolase [Saprospiraceae bacterium]|nr:MBL fold metallo-hydrolase [Saprospiraceae bacterium]
MIRYLQIILYIAGFFYTSTAQQYVLLGVTQDAGYPQIGCQKECCLPVWKDLSKRKYPVSLAIIDSSAGKWYLIDATPDMKYQIQLFHEVTQSAYPYMPEAILLTHAHIGHYTGLIDLGREAMNAQGLKVYGSRRMKKFISKNGPWQQLVKLKNIDVQVFEEKTFDIGSHLKITPLKVPHRDEYTDTYAFEINGKDNTCLYLPDIDKWQQWSNNIIEVVNRVDIAFIDATFYSGAELNFRRNIAEIPHPFVVESIDYFKDQTESFKNKLNFIHLNHTNPLLRSTQERVEIEGLGYRVGEQGKVYEPRRSQ